MLYILVQCHKGGKKKKKHQINHGWAVKLLNCRTHYKHCVSVTPAGSHLCSVYISQVYLPKCVTTLWGRLDICNSSTYWLHVWLFDVHTQPSKQEPPRGGVGGAFLPFVSGGRGNLSGKDCVEQEALMAREPFLSFSENECSKQTVIYTQGFNYDYINCHNFLLCHKHPRLRRCMASIPNAF